MVGKERYGKNGKRRESQKHRTRMVLIAAPAADAGEPSAECDGRPKRPGFARNGLPVLSDAGTAVGGGVAACCGRAVVSSQSGGCACAGSGREACATRGGLAA